MKHTILILMLLVASYSFSQNNLFLSFEPKVGGQDLLLNTNVQDLNGTFMKIEDFNYYVSNIHVIYDGGQDLDLSDTILLVKADNYTFKMGVLEVPNIEEIKFSIGVPQAINHQDISQYPEDHFLSWQSPSMHWGWTSGYKFLLIDGFGDNTSDSNPNNLFQLHCLGDPNFKNVSIPMGATYSVDQTDIIVFCNLDEWMYGANPGTVGVLHGDNGLNADIMTNANTRNVFEQPGNVGIVELNDQAELFFFENGNDMNISWSDMTGIDSYQLIDMNGRIIINGQSKKTKETINVGNVNNGSFIFRIYNEDNQTLKSIKVIR